MSTDADAQYLELFPAWLRTLGEDGEGLLAAISDENVPETARRALVGGLNYLFKSLDLIPDGIDDIGYLDDAFVLRVASDLAVKDDLGKASPDVTKSVMRLANDADSIREFLGNDYARLEAYVVGLRKGAARGRSVDDIVTNESIRSDFAADVRGFSRSYSAPSFAREARNLIKLRAFFDAKLPR